MLKSPLSSPIKRTLRSAFTPSGGYAPAGYDTDAQAYITAVETADSASLETDNLQQYRFLKHSYL